MSFNQHQTYDDSEQYSSDIKHRSENIDKIDDLLLLSLQTEMDNKINKNSLTIIKVFKNCQNKLYNNYELKKDEIEKFTYSLKFLDTLNLFMTNNYIESMLKLTDEITNLMHVSTHLENKDDIIHKIKYAEKSIIYYKKKIFKNLYFTDSQYLAKEIEKSLNSINQNYEYSNLFDRKTFKQMQNIFWVVQKKLDDEQKKFLQEIINEMKNISIKSRSRKFPLYDYKENHNNYYNTFSGSTYPVEKLNYPNFSIPKKNDYDNNFFKPPNTEKDPLPETSRIELNPSGIIENNKNSPIKNNEKKENFKENNIISSKNPTSENDLVNPIEINPHNLTSAYDYSSSYANNYKSYPVSVNKEYDYYRYNDYQYNEYDYEYYNNYEYEKFPSKNEKQNNYNIYNNKTNQYESYDSRYNNYNYEYDNSDSIKKNENKNNLQENNIINSPEIQDNVIHSVNYANVNSSAPINENIIYNPIGNNKKDFYGNKANNFKYNK